MNGNKIAELLKLIIYQVWDYTSIPIQQTLFSQARYCGCNSSADLTLKAFRHNLTDVASYHYLLEQVLDHWLVPAVPLVLRRNEVATPSH